MPDAVTRLVAIRHGETAWNVDSRIQGQIEVALNARGRWQAQRVAQALVGEPISALYASDLARAWVTAQAIARACAVPLQAEPGLRERRFGTFEGQTYAEIAQRWPAHHAAWLHREPDWSPPGGGESLRVMRDRVASTIDALASRHPGGLVVLVAHGGVMDQLYRLATGQALQAPRSWALGNAAINRLLWCGPGRLSLVGWADTQHLQEGALDETSA